MRNKFKKTTAFAGALAMSFSCAAGVFAAEFADMPSDWTTEALENAVENGLLYGEESLDGTQMLINPDDNITRAQMGAIIVRAFGASETTDISNYTDVDPDAWYYTELSKAVAMNALRGDGDLMNPNDNITFQECFTVISQLLQLHFTRVPDDVEDPDAYTAEMDAKTLSVFSDSGDVAQWAIPYAAAVVRHGYWDGIDGKLLPTEYITRSEFAVLMNNIASTYISEAGTYSDIGEGGVMVRSGGVTISGADISGDIIVGDGVSDEGFTLDNTQSDGYMYIRGGGENVLMRNNSFVQMLYLINPDITIEIDSTSDAVEGGHSFNDSNRVILNPTFE